MTEMRYRDALKLALREEMLRDENVILLGEDIGVFGGAFKVTSGLRLRRRQTNPALISAASTSQRPVSTSSPAACSCRTPAPATRGSGSSKATTTRRIPAAISASVQGGVRPQWQQGSRLT